MGGKTCGARRGLEGGLTREERAEEGTQTGSAWGRGRVVDVAREKLGMQMRRKTACR